MLPAALQRILSTVPDDALVLDVGGWAIPFSRADWVLDLMPYDTRGGWGHDGEPSAERFTAETWVQRDLCAREPWPFADDQFGFAVCSHTLEDVRDPIFACGELVRVAKAGYVEVPSRLWEQSWGVQGEWVGFGHHHWLVDVDQDRGHLDFLFKAHVIHGDPHAYFPRGFVDTLSEPEKRTGFWWTGGFSCAERVHFDAEALHEDLRAIVRSRPWTPPAARRLRRSRIG